MKVSTRNFQRFLRKRGWFVVNHPNENMVYLESPKDMEGDWSSVVLPANMELTDSYERIDQALNSVAASLDVSKSHLANNIERWDIDILSTKLDSRNVPITSIPLSLATIIVDDLRSFVGYAAYTEVSPAKFFARAGRVASDFASSCNFGHTFEGSFGMTIECPLSNVQQLSLTEDLQESPFERLVMLRIARGYHQIQQAKEAKDPQILLEGYKVGMNANMLRTLVDIYENLESQLQIEYSLIWAPEIAPPEELNRPAALKFDGLAHDLARYAANELEREKDEQQTTVVSYVHSLNSEMPLIEGIQDEFEHVITLNWEREKGTTVTLRVVLPAGEYKKACDAHKNGKKIVITGIPEKEGKFWFLSRPSEIKFSTH